MWIFKYAKYPTRFILLNAVIGVFLFCSSCQQKQVNEKVGDIRSIIIDTSDAAGTFSKVKGYNAVTIDSIYTGIIADLRKNNKYSLLLKHLSYYQALSNGNKEKLALIANSKGYAYNYLAVYDSAHIYFEESIALYKVLNATDKLADTYLGLGTNYTYKGDYAMAFSYYYKSLNIYEQLKDSNNIYRAKSEIAIDLYYQKEFQKAILTARSCLTYYQKNKDMAMIAYSQSTLATLYYNTGAYQTSIEYASASLTIRKQLGIEHDVAESLNNLSLAYMALEQWDKAIVTLRESLALMQKSNDIRQIPIIKQNLANCIWRTGNMPEAERLLTEVIDDAIKNGQKDAIANAYRKLSNLYRDKKDFANALKYYQKYKSWSDSLYNFEKEKAISELNIKYETEEKVAQITKLNAEKKVSSIKQIVYIICLFSISVVAILATLFLTNRNRKNKLIIEKVRLELEINEKDLTNFTEHIIAKNKFIDELEAKLNDLSIERLTVEENNESLSELYQFKILTEDHWRQFKIHFDKVYPGFITILREKYPDLAPAEERQFLLIKLNINNKESADMLGISLPSVKKNRYRLKKRFDLTEQDDLDTFVKKMA